MNIARATTSGGIFIRVATASLQSINSSLTLDTKNINPKTIVKRKSVSRAVYYLFYVEKNFKLILEIASEATVVSNYEDWWWRKGIL